MSCFIQSATFTVLFYGALYMDGALDKLGGDIAELAFRAAMILMTISN